MNLPLFISRRISRNETGSFSAVINRVAVVSIAVALAALISAYMILNGFEKAIKNKVYAFSGHLLVSKYSLSTSFEETSIMADDSTLQALRQMPEVNYVQTFALKAGLLKANDEVQGVFLKGVDRQFDTLTFAQHMVAGYFPIFPDSGYSTGVVLSRKIANYLLLNVGDQITVFFVQNPPRYRLLQVTGIYETGMEDFDEKMILGDINLVRRVNGWDEQTAGGLEIFLNNPEDMERVEQRVFDRVGYDLYVDKVSDKFVQIFDWLRMLDRNMIIFFTLIVFVASFNMVSILLILIMERTRMIGTLKAFGASDALLRKIFLFNGLQLILKGAFWGNLVGLVFCWLQYTYKWIPLDPVNYYMDHVPVDFDFQMLFLLNLLVVVLTMPTLYIPLLVISRIQPMRAIRFD